MAHRRPLTILLVTGLIGALGATSALAEDERPRRGSEPELRPGWARLHGPARQGPVVRRWAPRRGVARTVPPLALSSSLVRSETIFDGGERGLITQRIERGALASVDEDALDLELATGETSELTIGEGTRIVALERAPARRGRARLRTSVVEPAELEVGATVVAWSRAVEDGPFEASRVVVLASGGDDGAEPEASAEAGPMSEASPVAASPEPTG